MAPQSPDGLSLRVQCWHDSETGATRLRVERVDREEEIELCDGAFLLRVAFDRRRLIERCFIRHVASAREAYVQGGPGLSTFIRDSLLGGANPRETNTRETGGSVSQGGLQPPAPVLEGVDDDDA
jgi:hypothetical protein